MIRKVVVQNFKKFEHLEFTLLDHMVIAGPNNSGKTTLLQAIVSWTEFALQWALHHPVPMRQEDGNYPTISLNLLRFSSAPLADFDHLWESKNIQHPISIWLHTNEWKIGFELLYKEQELASVRPAKKVLENDLNQYLKNPLTATYIPPLSGLDIGEPFYNEVVIPVRLARAQAGSVLRNMLLIISQDSEKWKKLREAVRSFFGYELDIPVGAPEIRVRYRHPLQDVSFDLSSGASGFLQILIIYAALLYKDSSVLLIDEPDAHLHILLQNKIYQDLHEHIRENKSQLIIATHSERLINATEKRNLRFLSGRLHTVHDTRKLVDTLYLENTDIFLAKIEPGILYIEGPTDVKILREWARILGHPLFSYLERPFVWETATHEWPAQRHFSAMRLIESNFLGVELCDGNGRDRSRVPSVPKGMIRLYWDRYEIESYLIHAETLTRYVENSNGGEAAERIRDYMNKQLPPVLQENPFDETSSYLRNSKGKITLAEILNSASVNVHERDYYLIAAQMMDEEIHPEVSKKLDLIAEHFSL
ncbi:MAG: AAA family ATPase [Bacteroidetes bacterium]|nr:AAA family ATPase [Bacteroidota bacterium]MCY4205562.1 AAA family ATPase [Bacteroidota bacterium]